MRSESDGGSACRSNQAGRAAPPKVTSRIGLHDVKTGVQKRWCDAKWHDGILTLEERPISSAENRVQDSYYPSGDQPIVSKSDLIPVYRHVKNTYLADMNAKYMDEDYSRIVSLCRRDHIWFPIFGLHYGKWCFTSTMPVVFIPPWLTQDLRVPLLLTEADRRP